MSGLPLIPCPVCNSQIPVEVWMAHAGARQAIVALAEMHPGWRLGAVSLRYLALFAPEKRTLSLDRVAAILVELGDLIRPARVEWKGRTWAAPVEAWVQAMEEMLASTTIARPLKNHNYLRSVVAGLCDADDAAQERGRHQRGSGSTPVATSAAHRDFPPPAPRPAHNREAAALALAEAKANLKGHTSA